MPASRKASRPSVGRAEAEPAEVLVVEDDVLAVRPDQVWVVRVDAVGDDPDLDPGPGPRSGWPRPRSSPGAPRARPAAAAGLLGQICCADRWARRPCRPRGRGGGTAGPGRRPAARTAALASGTTARTAGLACSRATSAAEIVAEIALMMWKLRTCVACTWRSSASTPACAALAAWIRALRGGAPGGQAGELVLEDDDRAVRRVRRQALDLRGGEHGLRALEDPARRMGRYCRAAGGQRQQCRGP